MADKNPLVSLVDPYAWRSDMNAPGGMPTGGYAPQATLSAGPEPSAHEAMRNSIYSLLGGRPENAWSADKLAMLADVGTMGIPTSIYDGAREVARGGSSGQLAMALMPGMKPVGAAAKAVAPAVKEAVQGIKAYHGSPHDFDRFSLDRIGTGEGAQAYGHGLYFAENEGVAKEYKKQLTDRTNFRKPDGSLWDPSTLEHKNVKVAAYTGDLDAAIDKARQIAATDSPVREMAVRDLQNLEALKASGGIEKNPGRMYEVNIKADPNDFLDWDKPLSQQSENVQKAAQGLPQAEALVRGPNGEWINTPVLDREGDAVFHALAEALGKTSSNSSAASKYLKDAGIPGIKYLDQGSRAAGEGSRNYVVFDDSLIEILRKYGLLPPAAVAATQSGEQNPLISLSDGG